MLNDKKKIEPMTATNNLKKKNTSSLADNPIFE